MADCSQINVSRCRDVALQLNKKQTNWQLKSDRWLPFTPYYSVLSASPRPGTSALGRVHRVLTGSHPISGVTDDFITDLSSDPGGAIGLLCVCVCVGVCSVFVR